MASLCGGCAVGGISLLSRGRADGVVDRQIAPQPEDRSEAGRGRIGFTALQALDPGGQPAHFRVLEDGTQREFDTALVAQPCRQPGGQQGMAAQHEEVVFHARLFGQPENVGKGGGHLLFLGRAGRCACLHGKDRGGQRLAVHLAAGVDGQRCHQHDG